MKSAEFKALAKKALIDYEPEEGAELESHVLHGLGLAEDRAERGISRKNQVLVSEKGARYFLNYHCAYMYGGYDLEELNKLRDLFKNYVDVL